MSHILSLRWNSLQLFNISTKTFFHDISRKGYILFGQSDEFSTKTFFTISYLDKVMNFLNLLCSWGRRANTKSFVLNLKENIIFTLWERNSHDHILSSLGFGLSWSIRLLGNILKENRGNGCGTYKISVFMIGFIKTWSGPLKQSFRGIHVKFAIVCAKLYTFIFSLEN